MNNGKRGQAEFRKSWNSLARNLALISFQLALTSMASSSFSRKTMASSSFSRKTNYQVFLSFRGSDTRNTFVPCLLKALETKGFYVFFDDKRLRMGEELTPALLEGIKASKLSIIVLSKEYASSNSCLTELSQIMECKDTKRQPVVPIFYHVDPVDVRKISAEDFKDSFETHRNSRPAYEVKRWEDAFTRVGHLKGCHIKGDRSELEYIDKEIVPEVMEKLNLMASYEPKGLVGIDCQKEKIKSLLCIDEKDIRIIGIWGMGGMGKTTLAGAVYNEVRGEFDSCCFLGNVREESEKSARGIKSPRDQLLSELLGEKNIRIDTPDVACPVIKDRLSQKKVLVVLDDVQDSNQLEVLLMSRDDYGSGSRIIVTSRDKQVLMKEVDKNSIYEIQGLNDDHSLCLFSQHVFKQKVPLSRFENQSKTIVEYVKGNPLALKVLGGALYQRGEDYWQDQLKTLIKGDPIDKIIDDALRISFNGLGDVEKNIFLDIACFFKGFDKEDVIKILDGCYQQGALRGITHLEDKTLLTTIEIEIKTLSLLIHRLRELENLTQAVTPFPVRERVLMHDLIQAMGWNIVRSEPIGERSRVWASDDAHEVLNNQSRNEAMKGIFLDTSQISKIELSPEVFTRMPNLRFLDFYNRPRSPDGQCTLSVQSLACFPGYLRYLSWEHYPLKSFPSNFTPDCLVELRLPRSSLEQIWEGKKTLKNLRVINLKGCKNLTKIPDLSRANNLERLIIDGCESLRELPSMVHLKFLEPNFHAKLCSKLNKFPELPRHLKSLKLRNNEIKEVPESIEFLDQLEHLDLTGCSNLVEFPTSFKLPSTLTSLYLQGCKRLKSLPVLPVHSIDLFVSDCLSLRGVSGAQEFQYTPFSGTFISSMLRFGNCFKLDAEAVENIVANALLKIHGMANTWLKKKQGMGCIEVIVAGCEISRRFKYQSTNSSMTHVKLLNPDEPVVRSLGFVPFVVIDCNGGITWIKCKIELKTTGGECYPFESEWLYGYVIDQEDESFRSNHVFIWFHGKLLQEDKNYEEASFRFYARGQSRNGTYDEIEVKKCGVHVFYADAERIIIDSEGESDLINCDHRYGFCTSWADVMRWLCSRP